MALWEAYVQFAETHWYTDGEEEVSRVRAIYEEALTAVGLHVSQGARLWAAYRRFEQRIMPHDDERVRKLYQRQLALPLIGLLLPH